jgi:hypothetical protein
MKNKELDYDFLEQEARKLFSRDEVEKYVEDYYNEPLNILSRAGDTFLVLINMTTDEVSDLINKDKSNWRLKELYDIVYYLQHENNPNEEFYKVRDTLVMRYSL